MANRMQKFMACCSLLCAAYGLSAADATTPEAPFKRQAEAEDLQKILNKTAVSAVKVGNSIVLNGLVKNEDEERLITQLTNGFANVLNLTAQDASGNFPNTSPAARKKALEEKAQSIQKGIGVSTVTATVLDDKI